MVATAVVLTVSRFAVACEADSSSKARVEEQFRHTIPVGRYSRIKVSNMRGTVTVTGQPGADSIRIVAAKALWASTPEEARAALADLNVVITPQGGTLEIGTEHPEEWDSGRAFFFSLFKFRRGDKYRYEVNFTITVPASFLVQVESMTGEVTITNVRDADVEIVNGGISLAQVEMIRAKAINGSIEIDSCSMTMDLETINGSVHACMVHETRSVRIATVNGNIILSVPQTMGADLDIHTVNGGVRAEGLPLKNLHQDYGHLRGTLGNGGVPVKLETINGSITVTTQ